MSIYSSILNGFCSSGPISREVVVGTSCVPDTASNPDSAFPAFLRPPHPPDPDIEDTAWWLTAGSSGFETFHTHTR